MTKKSPAQKRARAKAPRPDRPHMPGYGIADAQSGKGLLPWSWAVDRLSQTQNYFLTTVRSDGRPHVMPVWGVWLDNEFYFSTGKRSVKARNLSENSNCVICPGGADDAVILEGAAHRVNDKAVLKRFGDAYFKKYKFDVSTMKEPVFAVRPRVVFGQIEKTYTESSTRWTFD